MSELFENYYVDLENTEVYKRMFRNTDEDGYHVGCIRDKYGNAYHGRHEVMIAEKLNLPKHKWPTDEFGRRYVVDHIIPLSNGGTDSPDNLRLVPMRNNISDNQMTRDNFRNKKLRNPLGLFDVNDKLLKVYHSRIEIEEDGFNFSTVRKSATRSGFTSGGLKFRYL